MDQGQPSKETQMTRKAATLVTVVLVLAVYCTPGYGQATPATILEIDVDNIVNYLDDVSDFSRLATTPGVPTRATVRNFGTIVVIGDIVAVNGQPAKGTFLFHARQINLTTAANPGQAVADVGRANVNEQTFEILKSDGTPLGSIMASGLGVGAAPPGAPLAVTQGNNAIVGGTGAFLGARGQVGKGTTTVADRQASMAEDPANRRRNGGGKSRFVLHVIPMSPPELVMTAGGPAVTHSGDFSLVTASKPAAPGETLSLFVTGLGPTRAGIDPGQPFPSSPLAEVTSPIQATVNGRPADVIAAVGFPGQVETYQVNVRVPSGTPTGTARLQLTAAWIAGPAVSIPIQ
jgi:uncharacterized protein (TIGR03437 family)